jgi:hypothetical protein
MSGQITVAITDKILRIFEELGDNNLRLFTHHSHILIVWMVAPIAT